jgi:hypothetical protein
MYKLTLRPVLKSRERVNILRLYGWYKIRQNGSHAIFRHPMNISQTRNHHKILWTVICVILGLTMFIGLTMIIRLKDLFVKSLD